MKERAQEQKAAARGTRTRRTRYATFGFSDNANLDQGAMWPTSFALKKLTATAEKDIGALVKKAVSKRLISPMVPAPTRMVCDFPSPSGDVARRQAI